MNPKTSIWTGWDVVSIALVVLGLLALALIPSVLTYYSGFERNFMLGLIVLAGPFFILGGFGRRAQHSNRVRNESRPFDAPD
jgi:hypothetical protein